MNLIDFVRAAFGVDVLDEAPPAWAWAIYSRLPRCVHRDVADYLDSQPGTCAAHTTDYLFPEVFSPPDGVRHGGCRRDILASGHCYCRKYDGPGALEQFDNDQEKKP